MSRLVARLYISIDESEINVIANGEAFPSIQVYVLPILNVNKLEFLHKLKIIEINYEC